MITGPLFKPFERAERLSLLSNVCGKPLFEVELEFDVMPEGRATGFSSWSIEGGALILRRGSYTDCTFNAMETRNGVVYAVGRFNQWEGRGCEYRAILNVKKPLGDAFGVCVSSVADYREKTLPVLLKSLRAAGLPKERCIVSVAGMPKGWRENTCGYACGVASVDAAGMTALADVSGEYPYWLLLHDTCDVDVDFMGRIADVDVGLSPDMVLMGDSGVGIYATRFINDCVRLLIANPKTAGDAVGMATGMASVCVRRGTGKVSGKRDVYGYGVRRKIESLGMGIVKFSRLNSDERGA